MNNLTLAYAIKLPGAAQGASSTSEFEFKDAAGNNAEFTVPASVLNKKRFKLVARGRVTGGTTTNFTAKLYVGTALGTAIFTSGAIAVNSTSGTWVVTAEGATDPTGDKFVGVGTGAINATLITAAVATAAMDPDTALVFSASGTFSASNANNAAYMDEFSLELM